MKVSFAKYPAPFQKAFALLAKNPGGRLPDSSKSLGKFVFINQFPAQEIIRAEELHQHTFWFNADIAPCFFIGAAVKDKSGLINRAIAAHIGIRFHSSELEMVFSGLPPIMPDERISAYIAGSSQRFSEDFFLSDVNAIVKGFSSIGLALKADTTNWRVPIITDIHKNIIVSDLGNMEDEQFHGRIIYFGVTKEDAMLFSVQAFLKANRRLYRLRIITSDVGVI